MVDVVSRGCCLVSKVREYILPNRKFSLNQGPRCLLLCSLLLVLLVVVLPFILKRQGILPARGACNDGVTREPNKTLRIKYGCCYGNVGSKAGDNCEGLKFIFGGRTGLR